MALLREVMCIALFITSSWAWIPSEDVKVTVFGDKEELASFDQNVRQALEDAKSFLDKYKTDIETAFTVGSIVPYLGDLAGLVPALTGFLNNDAWKAVLINSLAEQLTREIAKDKINNIKSTLISIDEYIYPIKLYYENGANDTKHEVQLIGDVASLQRKLNDLLNNIVIRDFILRKYPLLTAPLMIAIATKISVFTPLAKKMLSEYATRVDINCKMLDILYDYRNLTVDARVDKLSFDILPHLNEFRGWQLAYVAQEDYWRSRSLREGSMAPFHEDSYINCTRGCAIPSYPLPDLHCNNQQNPILTKVACLKDAYSEDVFTVGHSLAFARDRRRGKGCTALERGNNCLYDYMRHVIDATASLFPVNEMNWLCKNPGKLEGDFGWFTIRIKNVHAFRRSSDDVTCDLVASDGCDPYVKLFINGTLVDTSLPGQDTDMYYADVYYRTLRMKKNFPVKIEVWDKDLKDDDLLFSVERPVTDFLKYFYLPATPDDEPLPWEIYTPLSDPKNGIEQVSFWQDDKTFVKAMHNKP